MPPSRGSGGPAGAGPGGGRRIVAGSIVYKFSITMDDDVRAQLAAFRKDIKEHVDDLQKLAKQYGNIKDQGEGGFKAINLAVASFFALMIANSTTTRDMFGAIFSSLGSVMDSIAVVFMPLVTFLIDKFSKLATHIYDITGGISTMDGAFRGLGRLISEGLVGALKFAVKFAIDFAVTGVPNINKGVEDFTKDLLPGIRELASLSLESAAYALTAKLVSKGLMKMGLTKEPLGMGAALAIGLGTANWGDFVNAANGDQHAQAMMAGGLSTGLTSGVGALAFGANPKTAAAVGIGGFLFGEVGGGALYDMFGDQSTATTTSAPSPSSTASLPTSPPASAQGGLGLGVDKIEANATVPVSVQTTYNVSPSMSITMTPGSGSVVNNYKTDSTTTTGP